MFRPSIFGIGMTIHQATRSKELVNLLHAAGHSISYDKVRQVDTTIALKELEDFHQNGNVSIPSNIQSGKFFQFVADNIDIIEDTLDGKETFHATQMAIFQNTQISQSTENVLPILPEKTLKVPREFHEVQKAPFMTERPKPQFQSDVTSEIYEYHKDSDASAQDLAFVLSKIKGAECNKQNVPSWTGFNQSTQESAAPLTTIGYLPIINLPAHENDTLWTVMMRALQISHAKNPGQSTVLTFDEQLYCKAKELQWKNPEICKQLVLRLGGFHILLNYLKVIGKHFKDSGLEHVWVESSVYGENTANNIMGGKSYNRTVRAHKLTYDALWRILWPEFLKWAADNEINIPEELNIATESLISGFVRKPDHRTNAENLSTLVSTIIQGNLLHHIDEFARTLSPTSAYWWQYIQMVDTLLQYLRAEREGNWQLHLSSFAAMLPWIAIYDHFNYMRWGSVYLADMKQLETSHIDVYREFSKGGFVVKKTQQAFNQLSTDHALEQINRKCKVAGGLIGITRTDSARDRWCLTSNQRSKLADQTFAMFGLDDEGDLSVSHNESSPSRIKRDEQDVIKIQQQFIRFKVFDGQQEELVSLATKDVASEDVRLALFTAEDRGKELVDAFITERLASESQSFYDTIKQNKSKTFHSLYLTPGSSSTKEKSDKKMIKADRKLFQRILVARDAGRDVNLENIMSHEISPVPLSLAHPGGKLRTPINKSQLATIGGFIDQERTQSSLPSADLSTCVIIDGQALVQALGKPKKASTFGDLADSFTSTAFGNLRKIPHCTRVDVPFDRYVKGSIKSGTRAKRAGAKSKLIRRIIDDPSVPLPANWKSFIDMPENKANLTDFLSSSLIEKGKRLEHGEVITAGGFSDELKAESTKGRDVHKLQSNHEEADTRIILHALEAKECGYQRTIVICKDTDVIVLLAHFKHLLSQELWMQTGKSKEKKYIPIHDIQLPQSVSHNLPAFHALTGCDTVSQFHGISKKNQHGKCMKQRAIF